MIENAQLRKYGVALLAPRICVLGYDPCGGSEVILWEDVGVLQDAGIPVRVYGGASRDGAPVIKISMRTNAPLLTSLEYCIQYLLKERNSFLLAYNEPTVAGLAPDRVMVRFDWNTGLPRYWKLPGWLSRFQRACYLFPSQSERNLFLKINPLIPQDSTVVIANAVDPDLFKPERAPSARSLRVGFAGQWEPGKGVAVLLEAWKIVKAQFPVAELWLAGGPHLWKAIKALPGAHEVAASVEAMEKQALVHNAGTYSRSRMPVFWNSVSVAVVPSFHESFGLAALEAMACGVPVVASAVGGLTEIVVHDDCGLLVPSNNPERLAEALLMLLKNEPLRYRLSEAARRRAELFSKEGRAQQLLGLIDRISERADIIS